MEIFKVEIRIAPIIMNETFTFVESNTYNLRKGMRFSRENVHSTQYSTESVGNLAAKKLESCSSQYERFEDAKCI